MVRRDGGLDNQRLTPQNNTQLGSLAALFANFPFADRDATLVPRKQIFADPAHIEAVREGEKRIDPIVRGLLAP
jgi:hypothetical protein